MMMNSRALCVGLGLLMAAGGAAAYLWHESRRPPGLFYELRGETGEALWRRSPVMVSEAGDYVYCDTAWNLVVVVSTANAPPETWCDDLHQEGATLLKGTTHAIEIHPVRDRLLVARQSTIVGTCPLDEGFAERLRRVFGRFGSTFPNTEDVIAEASSDGAEVVDCFRAAMTRQ